MTAVAERVWVQIYQDWKSAHPELARPEMNDRRKRMVRGCKGKMMYDSRDEAAPIAQSLPRRGLVINIYPCPICARWHIGNSRFRKEVIA